MLTASRSAPGPEHREATSPTRPWPVNGTGRSASSASTGDERHAAQFSAAGLGSLLVCDGCDWPLQLSWDQGGTRMYVFLCGCHRNGVDAGLIDRLVRDRVEAESALLVTGVAAAELPVVFRALFAAVRIGHGPEDLQFVWRI